jgi:hypothetical protein
MAAEFLFNAANIFVLPFWALMVIVPNWQVTQKVMDSFLPFLALAGAYFYLFIAGITPDAAQDFSNAGLSDIARLFSQEQFAATAWVHLVVMDLFAGRWVYQNGLQANIFTRHSLALCLFAGPLGLLSHILTRWGVLWVRARSSDTTSNTASDMTENPEASATPISDAP